MTDVPVATPVAMPLNPPIVAVPVLPLAQLPPETRSPNAVVDPTHTESVPVMPVGVGLTATVVATTQPPGAVYVMAEVPSVDPVETTPLDRPIMATDVLPLNHVPPPTASDSAIVEPRHSADGPKIVPGDAYTVTTFTTEQLPPNV
jgi:hypothetical protein